MSYPFEVSSLHGRIGRIAWINSDTRYATSGYWGRLFHGWWPFRATR